MHENCLYFYFIFLLVHLRSGMNCKWIEWNEWIVTLISKKDIAGIMKTLFQAKLKATASLTKRNFPKAFLICEL